MVTLSQQTDIWLLGGKVCKLMRQVDPRKTQFHIFLAAGRLSHRGSGVLESTPRPPHFGMLSQVDTCP